MLDMDDLATLEGQNWLNDQVRDAWCLCSLSLSQPVYMGVSVVRPLLRSRWPILAAHVRGKRSGEQLLQRQVQ